MNAWPSSGNGHTFESCRVRDERRRGCSSAGRYVRECGRRAALLRRMCRERAISGLLRRAPARHPNLSSGHRGESILAFSRSARALRSRRRAVRPRGAIRRAALRECRPQSVKRQQIGHESSATGMSCPYGIVRPDQPAGPWRPLSSRESSGAPAPSPKCRSAASSRRCECCGSQVRRAGSGP